VPTRVKVSQSSESDAST